MMSGSDEDWLECPNPSDRCDVTSTGSVVSDPALAYFWHILDHD